jgi:large subunit ribosomal protein L25
MAKVTFTAHKREECGSGKARQARAKGLIPGVIYGRGKESRSINIDGREFSQAVRSITESTLVDVNIDGTSHEAFVKDMQQDVVSGNILHVDFYEIARGEILRAKIRVYTKGSPIGIREGGILERPTQEVEVESLPQNLPERIVVDIGGLGVNQSIHTRDLQLGEGVKLITNPDQVVALVKFAKAEAATAEGAAEEGAATTAAGAAAAAPAADTADKK